MNKNLLFCLLLLLPIGVYAANTLQLTGSNGWLYANTTGKSGVYICLEDGTNCPASGGGGGGNLTLAQWLVNWSSSNIGNWTADSVNYYTKTNINNLFNGQNNLSLSQIGTNLGNWSADKSSYYTITSINNLFNGQNNLSLGQIATNLGNWSLDRPNYVNLSIFNTLGNWSSDRSNYVNFTVLNGAVGQNLTHALVVQAEGNWSADKSTYLQNLTHANFTKFSINTSPQVSYNGSCFNFTGATSQWLVC